MPEGVSSCEKKTVPGSLPHLEPHPLRPRPSSGSFGVHYRLLLLGGAHSPLTEVQQPDRIPQPEVVAAANSPNSLGGTAPPRRAPLPLRSRHLSCQGKRGCFLPLYLLTCLLNLPPLPADLFTFHPCGSRALWKIWGVWFFWQGIERRLAAVM